MAIVEVKEVILQGDADTRSAIVDTLAVKKGMILSVGATGAGYCQPAVASTAETVIGIALYDADVGDVVTYAMAPCIARVVLAESQTITEGERLAIGSTTISSVTTYGQVASRASTAFAATYDATNAGAVVGDLADDIGYALEDKTTGADATAVLKIKFEGRKL